MLFFCETTFDPRWFQAIFEVFLGKVLSPKNDQILAKIHHMLGFKMFCIGVKNYLFLWHQSGFTVKPDLWWILAKKQSFLGLETFPKKKTSKIAWNHRGSEVVSKLFMWNHFETTLVSQKKTFSKIALCYRYLKSKFTNNFFFWKRKYIFFS